MYPDLFGVNNLSYTLCLILGIAVAIVFACIYLWKNGFKKDGIIDLLICSLAAVSLGIVFSVLFENLYEFIEKGTSHHWVWKMTFFGGLFGGVLGFLLTYLLLGKKVKFDIRQIVIIAPICIVFAHGIGRIGCFLAGCCYGKPTDSWIGIDFPNDGLGKVIPTQLIEAIFLFLLATVMVVLLLVKKFKYNFLVYLASYSIFRFVIEFYRGDERGVAFALSPSQVWCILIFLGLPPLFLLLRHLFNNEKEQPN